MDREIMKSRLAQVVHTTALEPRTSDFLATHIPFKNLRYVNSGLTVENASKITEEHFFEQFIIEKMRQHNFVVVQGDNGSGKSHFIRWLSHRYENEVSSDGEIVIKITRGQNTLKGALQQIIQSSVFNDISEKQELDKIVNANQRLTKDEVKMQIAALLAAETKSEDDDSDRLLKQRYKKLLYSFLVDDVVQEHILLKKRGPIDRILSRLIADDSNEVQNETEPRFTAVDFNLEHGDEVVRLMNRDKERSSDAAIRLADAFLSSDKGEEIKNNVASYLNSKLDKVIQNCIKLSTHDLREVFQQIRAKLKQEEKSLTLFIEDITSFTGIDKALVEALLINHEEQGNEHLCRLTSFVGITNSYYQDSIPDNIRQRVSGRVIIDSNSLIVAESDICEMAGRYLNAIRTPLKEMEQWLEQGGKDQDLPISASEKKWADTKLKDGRILSLYPFNERAIWNIYNGLEIKTPRTFLQAVMLNVLPRFLDNPHQFPPREEELLGINIKSWGELLTQNKIEQQAKEDNVRIGLMLRIWGNGTIYQKLADGKRFIGEVSEDIFKEFALPIIDGISNPNSTLPVNGKKVDGTEAVKGKSTEVPSNIGTTVGGETVPTTVVKEQTQLTRNEKEYEKYLKDIEKWKNGGELVIHALFREDFCKLLKTFINWEEEDVSPVLINNHITMGNVDIEGQIAKTGRGHLIRRDTEGYFVLLSLLAWRYKGNRSWVFANADEYLLRLTNYIIKNKERLIAIAKYPSIEYKDIWNAEQWLLLNEYYIRSLNGELQITDTSEELYKRLMVPKLMINNQCNKNEVWRSIIGQFAIDPNIVKHHEQTIRLNNLILGQANPETTDTMYFDAYKILSHIDQLTKDQWDLNKVLSQVKKLTGTSNHFISVNLMKESLGDKIDKILERESYSIQEILMLLRKHLGDSFDKSIVDTTNARLNVFLTQKLYDLKENYNNDLFKRLEHESSKGEKIVESYKYLINAMSLKSNQKLIALSTNVQNEMENYAKMLGDADKLINEIKIRYEVKIGANQTDEIAEIDKYKTEIKSNIEKIKSELNKLTEVQKKC